MPHGRAITSVTWPASRAPATLLDGGVHGEEVDRNKEVQPPLGDEDGQQRHHVPKTTQHPQTDSG